MKGKRTLIWTGRPIAALSLPAEEGEALGNWVRRRPKNARAVAPRVGILLEAAVGNPNTVMAHKLGITKQTIGKWRQRLAD